MIKALNNLLKWVKKIYIHPNTLKIATLVILAELMILPFNMSRMDLINPAHNAVNLYPLTVLFSDYAQRGLNFFYVSSFLLFILPIAFMVIFISIFQRKISQKTVYLTSLISISFYLAAAISGMNSFANTPRWFYSLSTFTYIAFFTALIFHIFLIAHGIISIKKQNSAYMEYKKLLKDEEKREETVKKRITEKLKRQKDKLKKQKGTQAKEELLSVENLLKKSVDQFATVKKRTHIKTKITIVIIFTILVILSTFIYTDLRNYNMLLTQNVNTTGKNQAEQVAAIYSFSDGLHAKIRAFLEGIKKTNDSSPFPFQRVDIITTSSKQPIFLEEIDEYTELPLFDVFSYTTAVGHVKLIPDEEKIITPEEAALYIEHCKNESTVSTPIYKNEKGTCLYVYPITFTKKEGQRLLGFSVVTYLREILDRPYFQALVFVLSISAVFFYASIIIVLFLADFIANPIIFLCGNIRKTANILSDMIASSASVEPDRLIFEENVKTHDEIKTLSVELKNIISLIRGILPYVSFHTIQNAEKNLARKSYNRDLCFLFTDIRGFTTMCENMQPKEVISILNRYLDIETKIIFENGGDVDKYVGDEIMAFFSGTKKEINACKAAMEIRKAMRREQRAAAQEGSATISIGIGINSGPVVFGPVGSKTRKDFTSIGDTVNLAARLEGANKEYGSKSIISEAVYENLDSSFICRELDLVTVKGKTEPVRIFEILQPTEKLPIESIKEIKKLFETGLAYYRKRKWKQAEKFFLTCVERYNDTPSKVFLKRIAHYQVSPPKPRWSGVFVMNVK
ncbi:MULTISPECIES: adenylate/guanylate cyclase domain-containing protein [unclassified Treponema]|uniref:adenylate/guanylate cyclase domain-containing protein n=1 Tax=unclassified Treponema TaxID=2638727 RepID=UPI0020A54BB3|nr:MULTISPECIES: adenylate/guanylate cyclase domain-containing protein [unclassified Treponema]UTC66638.1 adenylate/guanylate cyclase domain-containing protein [Treponema sp. OMZ 789]UTC69370.1 adenylate/guanylate cyclase domain-containing protein [Treponema sp. OMZ 790]UTC72085.1 adenylate/guanylate cyclase domain-containing protein [Treponema sp. OMZ 791]